MKCKYLFQDKDHFGGEQYCTCFNEQCRDISFVCPDNCQINEDNKKLEKYKNTLVEIIETIKQTCDFYKNNNSCIGSGCSKYYKQCAGYKILNAIKEAVSDNNGN